MEEINLKLSKKIMILSLFLVIVCCIGSVSATDDASDNTETTIDNVDIVEDNNDNLGTSDNDVLSDGNSIFVNGSSENSGSGGSWDDPLTDLKDAPWEVYNNNDKIYLANGEYVAGDLDGVEYSGEPDWNIYFIGQDRENTIITGDCQVGLVGETDYNTNLYVHHKYTFINLTFNNFNIKLENDKEFINCTFINSPIVFGSILSERFLTNTDLKDSIDSSLTAIFKNCTFKDYVDEHSYIISYPYGQVSMSECTFENITADSIISSSANGAFEDGIHISNSKFINVTVNGIMDVEEQYATFENNGNVTAFRPSPPDSKIIIAATKKNLTITLKDSEGNIIKNASITITAPSHDPNFRRDITTNDKGIAVYDMAGADWTVWCAEYDGIKSRTFSAGPAEASVNLKTLAKGLNVQFTNVTDVTGKTMLVVTVKNNLSEIVSNTNFTFTLNGKDYNATTDANGQFIASGLTGDVSVGVKYNGTEYNALDATSNFTFPKTESEDNTPSGNTTPTNTTPSDDKKPSQPNTPAKKVTPVATKITAKKATFKAKKKAKKYSITLKAGKKTVAKVKVTLKVGKKTYKATTNKKGKAIFNLKKLTKKGKYTAVIKFKGNKNYKATSKKVKIIVK